MELLGLNLYAWFTIVTVLTMFSLLLTTKLPASVAHQRDTIDRRSAGGFQLSFGGRYRCIVRGGGRSGAYGRAAMDHTAFAGHTEVLPPSHRTPHAARSAPQLRAEQQYGSGTLYQCGENVV